MHFQTVFLQPFVFFPPRCTSIVIDQAILLMCTLFFIGPGLLPVDSKDWNLPWDSPHFCVLKNGKHLSMSEIFQRSGLESQNEMFNTLYKNDEVWRKMGDRLFHFKFC